MSDAPPHNYKNVQYLNLAIHRAHTFVNLPSEDGTIDLSAVHGLRRMFNPTVDEPSGGYDGAEGGQEGLCLNASNPNHLLTPVPQENEESQGLAADLDMCWQAAGLEIPCNGQRCEDLFGEMSLVVPTSEFADFREKVIRAMACQMAMRPDPFDNGVAQNEFERQCNKFVESDLILPHSRIAKFVEACLNVFKEAIENGTEAEETIHAVDGVIYWMANIQFEMGIGASDFGAWTSSTRASALPLSIRRALRQVDQLKVCKHRIWTLVEVSDRKEADLPDIVAALASFYDINELGEEGRGDLRWLHDRRRCCVDEGCNCVDESRMEQHCSHLPSEACPYAQHRRCSASKCQTATMDSTLAGTMHVDEYGQKVPAVSCTVCPDDDEENEKIRNGALEIAVETGAPTAWRSDEDACSWQLADVTNPYVALSHVWSDGTGTFSQCTWKYLKRQVAKLQPSCDYIWWDAISVPTKSKKHRMMSLKSMHQNYKNAACTIVHDERLMKVKWARPRDLCLPLVLSTWFTRGWTALELAVSKNVKVLVYGGEGAEPVLKDLDEDILAFGPECATRAEWIASAWLRRLREPIDDVGDVVGILSRRTTSFVRDQAIIAGLLAGVPDFDTTQSEAVILENTLQYLGKVPYQSLLHGKPTMSSTGGFSWSPTSVNDMKMGIQADIRSRLASDYFGMLDVFYGGSVRGEWQCGLLPDPEGGVADPVAAGTDLASTLRVDLAIQEYRDYCLLLIPPYESPNPNQALLVTVVGPDFGRQHLQCQYVGLVSCQDIVFYTSCIISIGSYNNPSRGYTAEGAITALRVEVGGWEEGGLEEEQAPHVEDVDDDESLHQPHEYVQRSIDSNSEASLRFLFNTSRMEKRLQDRDIKNSSDNPADNGNDTAITKIRGYITFAEILIEAGRLQAAQLHLETAANDITERYNAQLTQNGAYLGYLEVRLMAMVHNRRGKLYLKNAERTLDNAWQEYATAQFRQACNRYDWYKKHSSPVTDLEEYSHASSRHVVSEWKRVWLDSLSHIVLLGLNMQNHEAASAAYTEVLRHFAMDKISDRVDDEEAEAQDQRHTRRQLLRDQQKQPLNRMLDLRGEISDEDAKIGWECLYALQRARSAFNTIFRQDHAIVDLSNYYVGLVASVLRTAPSPETHPSLVFDQAYLRSLARVKERKFPQNYFGSAAEGLGRRGTVLLNATIEMIKAYITEQNNVDAGVSGDG